MGLLGGEAPTQVFSNGTPLLLVFDGGGPRKEMGELGVPKAADDVQDALLAGVPPDGHLLEVLSKVGQGVLAAEERRESARGVHRWRSGGVAAWSVGRGALGGSTESAKENESLPGFGRSRCSRRSLATTTVQEGPSRDSRKGSQKTHWTCTRDESSLESSGCFANRAPKSVKASPLDPKTDLGIL